MVVTDAPLSVDRQSPAVLPADALGEVQRAREDERRRLSAELHDGVVQWMVGALFRLRAYNRRLSTSPEHTAAELAQVEETLTRSVRELRRIIADLRPLPLEELGLVAALRQAAESLGDCGIRCHFRAAKDLPELTPAEERATFGIIREALTNVRKHSRATSVWLHIEASDHTLSAEVRDDGKGFNPEKALGDRVRRDHMGLVSMKERAEQIGARLIVDSRPGQGTTVGLAFCPACRRGSPEGAGR